MSRVTSIEAYSAVKLNGTVKKLAFDVYHILFNHGPLTQGEAWKKFFPDHDRPTITPRFAELKRRGLIAPAGRRECTITGTRCMTWDVTPHLPSALPPPKSVKEQLREAQDRIAFLEKELKRKGTRPANVETSGTLIQERLI